MGDTQEEQWREEFEKRFSEKYDVNRWTNIIGGGGYKFRDTNISWIAYREACKKRTEEFKSKDDYYLKFKQLELEQENQREEQRLKNEKALEALSNMYHSSSDKDEIAEYYHIIKEALEGK